MKEKILEIFYNWDIENPNQPIDKDELKKRIEEQNDAILDPYIRDLEAEGQIEIVGSTAGTYWKVARITSMGRDFFRDVKNPYTEEMKIKVLQALRDYDQEHFDDYMSKLNLKKAVDEENDNIIDNILKDLEDEYYIDASSSISDKWQSIKITKTGRDFLQQEGF